MQINRIDHLVLTVANIDHSVEFYTRVMGMEKVIFGDGRVALTFAGQKINLHQLGNEFAPHADNIRTGSVDLCFIIDTPLSRAIEQLFQHNVEVIEGPVKRTGARGGIISAYLRDPDGNLIEISNYVTE
ncbi:MAG: VOC family protein [Gammaproteobacteria bacterium]|nr:VOC family protein [Gammaproteobacteria bacterium]MCP4978875.1 VOC family protein [Gammaproteobacteria bacterium]